MTEKKTTTTAEFQEEVAQRSIKHGSEIINIFWNANDNVAIKFTDFWGDEQILEIEPEDCPTVSQWILDAMHEVGGES